MTNSLILPTQSSHRLLSIDFTRGLVIVIMAIDHVRELLHTTALTQNPLNLETTTPALYFTRWITHLCAPTFVFLAGVSVFLMMKNANETRATRRFLFTRGLWLIFLEITVIGFGIWCDIQFRTFIFQVIFAIGAGFIILSSLLKLKPTLVGCIGVLILLLHNLLPAKPLDQGQSQEVTAAGGFLWGLFFHGGFFKLGAERALLVAYPVVPWLGVMLFGFGFGQVFKLETSKRKKVLLISGVVTLTLFIFLRALNICGDPRPWSPQSTGVLSFLSFMNVHKYPPSLLYISITLSIMFFILFLADERKNRFMSFVVVFGRVPFFFYLIHWYVIHASMFVMLLLQGITWQQMPIGVMQFGRPAEGVGLELPYLYLYWFCLVACMYPLCNWYGKYKLANRQNKWLAYL